MKDVKLNSLNTNQRKLLQIGVFILLVGFLIGYFFFQSKSASENNRVFLENSKLQVFNDTYIFNGYPDKILIHYPYFLLVQAEKPLTIIYNLETKQKEKEIKDVLLDYYEGNSVYNRKDSYFNDKNLGEYCDSAFIKSTNEVLCITKQSRDSVDNMLISINPDKPNLWKQVYQSENLLTNVSLVNNNLYIGEINFETKRNYLVINHKPYPVESIINIIYPIKNELYYATFKSNSNDVISYHLIESNNAYTKSDERIYFLY